MLSAVIIVGDLDGAERDRERENSFIHFSPLYLLDDIAVVIEQTVG